MIKQRTLGRGIVALTVFGLAVLLPTSLKADSAEGLDFAALQADAIKSFRDEMTPFVKNYCAECHGEKKRKGGINYLAALKKPGDMMSSKRWKQGLLNVKAHDMPPDDAKNQPTEEEREKFAKWIGKIKYLSPKDPGPFVMRRLTKVEYGNTLHDLFGVDPAIANRLPDEVFGEGYLNTLSSLQSEQYLGIANEVLDKILAPKDAPPTLRFASG